MASYSYSYALHVVLTWIILLQKIADQIPEDQDPTEGDRRIWMAVAIVTTVLSILLLVLTLLMIKRIKIAIAVIKVIKIRRATGAKIST